MFTHICTYTHKCTNKYLFKTNLKIASQRERKKREKVVKNVIKSAFFSNRWNNKNIDGKKMAIKAQMQGEKI